MRKPLALHCNHQFSHLILGIVLATKTFDTLPHLMRHKIAQARLDEVKRGVMAAVLKIRPAASRQRCVSTVAQVVSRNWPGLRHRPI